MVKSSENLTLAKTAFEMKQMQEATSLRQAAEWGMHAVQGSFPRLRDRFKYEANNERKIMLNKISMCFDFFICHV